MSAEHIVAAILALAVLLASLRLLLWQRAVRDDLPTRGWRAAALIALQPICALLLFLSLFPPPLPVAAGTLVVATAGTPASAKMMAGAHLVALPEAPAIAGAEPVPDLGTALRRYPGTGQITVLGNGLTPRDRDAARGLAVTFTPPPPSPGLVSLAPPGPVAPGAGFIIGGRVAGIAGSSVDLLDPAGRLTDRQKPVAAGWFTLSGTARAAGPVTFAVRLRDSARRQIEQADVPVLITDSPAPRLLIMAGAPGPEVKYLRRWATDAGFAVTTRMNAGGGVELGDAPVALDAASLKRFDAAIIDDRTWLGLGGQRAAVIAAVRDGLGLILRASGPLDSAARAQWQSLGFALSGGNALAPVALPKAPDPALARTRQGIGSTDVPADPDMGIDVLPEISRLALIPGGRESVDLLRDAGGKTLAAWRGFGAGRIALFTGIDSYGLTLTGRRDLYGDWWSAMISVVARPTRATITNRSGPTWVGERVTLCSVAPGARVEGPGGTMTSPIVDPVSGQCAAFWPSAPGWHVLHNPDPQNGEQRQFLYVQPSAALKELRAERDRQATLMLSEDQRKPRAAAPPEKRPGASWPWFFAWLAASALLWWLERSRKGRAADNV